MYKNILIILALLFMTGSSIVTVTSDDYLQLAKGQYHPYKTSQQQDETGCG